MHRMVAIMKRLAGLSRNVVVGRVLVWRAFIWLRWFRRTLNNATNDPPAADTSSERAAALLAILPLRKLQTLASLSRWIRCPFSERLIIYEHSFIAVEGLSEPMCGGIGQQEDKPWNWGRGRFWFWTSLRIRLWAKCDCSRKCRKPLELTSWQLLAISQRQICV